MINNRVNILIDCHFFDNNFVHGARIYIKGLYSQLIKIENNCFHFYFAAYNIESLKNEFGDQKNITYIKYRSQNRLLRLFFIIPNIIKTYKIDFLHVQYISPFRKTCREIVTIHDVLFNDFPKLFSLKYRHISNYLFKRSALRADLLLTVSEYSKNSIARHYGISLAKIFITPNAPSEFFNESLSVKKLSEIKCKFDLNNYILYVSRIEPRKNHLLLIQAYNELKLWDKGLKLIFIGKNNHTGKDLSTYYSSLPDLIKENIIFIDQVSNEELTAFYQNARLFVYPSVAEGFGIPPLEAAACGLPCLCSNATAMKDFTFFKDRLFDPANKEELKKKILNLLEYTDIAETKRIQDFVRNNYQWKKIAYDFYLILNKTGYS